jgi:hypothetical protein
MGGGYFGLILGILRKQNDNILRFVACQMLNFQLTSDSRYDFGLRTTASVLKLATAHLRSVSPRMKSAEVGVMAASGSSSASPTNRMRNEESDCGKDECQSVKSGCSSTTTSSE